MSGCGEGAEWVEQLRAPRQGHCTSQSQPVKATLLRRAVTLCATVAGWLRSQNGLIWYYLVHDNFCVSGLDWGTIIFQRNGKTGGFLNFFIKFRQNRQPALLYKITKAPKPLLSTVSVNMVAGRDLSSRPPGCEAGKGCFAASLRLIITKTS